MQRDLTCCRFQGGLADESRRNVDRFWWQALRDLATARQLLTPDGGYAAADYAHQAAEKALKACLWHLNAAEPPWRHDLERLAELVAQAAGELPASVDVAIAYLEPIFAETRYPSGDTRAPIPADAVGPAEAFDAVRSAQEVHEWVRGLLRYQQP
jgi:HEPN domain-containing protein